VSKSLILEVALKLRSVLLALVGVAASTAAIAADLPTRKQPPAPVPIVAPWSWTGFYLGGYLGGTFGSANWHDDGGSFGDEIGGPIGCGGPLDSCNFGGSGNSSTHAGFAGGGYVGYNYQFGSNWVLGIEGEFGYLGIGNSGDNISGNAIDGFGNLYPYGINSSFSDHEVARVRGRLGYAVEPQMLLYVAGGWTWTETNASISGYCCGTLGLLPPVVVNPLGPIGPIAQSNFSQSFSRGIDGWNIGVGGEYAFTPNWIARIEYIYDGFSNLNYNLNFFPNSSSAALFNDSRHIGLNVNTIRVGLEYKF
jgi:outer membrane immunogenic protein